MAETKLIKSHGSVSESGRRWRSVYGNSYDLFKFSIGSGNEGVQRLARPAFPSAIRLDLVPTALDRSDYGPMYEHNRYPQDFPSGPPQL